MNLNHSRDITLTLNENKRGDVTGDNQWGGLTWKEIVFEQ